MPRKLKTYITNLGFFELALAAPSMKAALEVWGMGHDAFRQGFAKETHDAKTVASAMAKPGIVLRRPVGTKGEFKENAELPKELWKSKPLKADPLKPKVVSKSRSKAKRGEENKADQAAILSFEKAKAQRDREREKAKAQQDVQYKKERVKIERALAKAQDAMDQALGRHEAKIAAIAREREKLDRREATEEVRWKAERVKLKDARERASK